MKHYTMPEIVECANPRCGNQTVVKINGTMPRRWFGVWDETKKVMHRVCSETCMEEIKWVLNTQ